MGKPQQFLTNFKPKLLEIPDSDSREELTPAASAGVQLGDQLLMVEVTELDGRMKKLSEKLCELKPTETVKLYVKSWPIVT